MSRDNLETTGDESGVEGFSYGETSVSFSNDNCDCNEDVQLISPAREAYCFCYMSLPSLRSDHQRPRLEICPLMWRFMEDLNTWRTTNCSFLIQTWAQSKNSIRRKLSSFGILRELDHGVKVWKNAKSFYSNKENIMWQCRIILFWWEWTGRRESLNMKMGIFLTWIRLFCRFYLETAIILHLWWTN